MKLFILDEKTKLPIANPELLTIKCFAELIRRNRKIDGDGDGRRKTLNEKELSYIYFNGVFDSRFKLKRDKEKEDAIKKLIGLDTITVNGNPLNWEPDSLVKECLSEFRELQVTASSEYVTSLEGTISALSKYLTNAKQQLETGTLTTVSPQDIKALLSVINDSPSTLDTIAKAKSILQKEQDALATGRKGRTVNKFELET
jgi:hypothetical protein